MGIDRPGRIVAARMAMQAAGLDCLLLSVGPDLPYLTGYEAMALERLSMLVLTSERADLVVPRLEVPRVVPGPFEVIAWDETDDPVALVSSRAGRPRRAGVGDHTWSVFLLALQDRLPATRFTSATRVLAELRIRKEPGEIELLRRAAQAADRVAARLATTPFAGQTERQLARKIADMTVEEGHDVAAFTIVASGPNGASPHHEPVDRPMEAGDLVVVDFGGRVGGYHSDITRTFSVGEPGPEEREVHDLVGAAHAAGLAAVRPGVPAEDVDRAARGVIDDGGYGSYFVHRTGHGIGLEGHEHPYLVAGNGRALEAGMCFSVEPGIYLPGRFGVRIEDIVTVTDDGVDPLNLADHSLVVVG